MINEKCIQCKAGCCRGLSIEVFGMDDIPLEYLIVRNKAFYMRKQKDHKTCIALSTNNLCTIYDNRPNVCKDFIVDNPRCKNIQKRIGI